MSLPSELTESIAKADAAIRKLDDMAKPRHIRRLEARHRRVARNARRLYHRGKAKRSSADFAKVLAWSRKARRIANKLLSLGWKFTARSTPWET